MSKHSKHNHTQPIFTQHERKLAGYGTQKARLGNDSLKPFDHCWLCLQTCINPVLTRNGYLYCKECLLENVIAQKQEIKRKQKQFAKEQKQLQQEEKEKLEQQQREELLKFEKTETSILPAISQPEALIYYNKAAAAASASTPSPKTETPTSFPTQVPLVTYYDDAEDERTSKKREHENDGNDDDSGSSKRQKTNENSLAVAVLLQAPKPNDKPAVETAEPEVPETMKTTALKSASSSNAVTAFWIPQATPQAKPTPMAKPPRTDLMDPASNKPFKVKELVEVNFNAIPDVQSNSGPKYQCPCCLKALTNALRVVVFRRCGHTLCTKCFTRFTAAASESDTTTCYTCGEKVANALELGRSKDCEAIYVETQGTAFVANGGRHVEAKKYSPQLGFS